MTDTHAAFVALVDAFRQLPETFTDPSVELSEQAQLQGYRHLAHLLSYGFELYMESDPLRPCFVPISSPTMRILGDNTDSIYYFTQVRGTERYRITGNLRDACYLSFCFYGGEPDGSWSDHIAAHINHTEIAFDEDGGFELFVGPDEPDKDNHFKLGPGAVCLITREYYFDRQKERYTELHIENTAEVPAPQPYTDQQLAELFRTVTNFVTQTTALAPLPPTNDTNVIGEPFSFDPDGMGWGSPDNIYAIAHFSLKDDEVLVLRGRSPKCCYWGAQTWNAYMQSYDSRYHKVSVNAEQVTLDDDGGWTIYLAKNDPGLPNWVGTAGHSDGIIFLRWLLAEHMPEAPTSQVVNLNALLR